MRTVLIFNPASGASTKGSNQNLAEENKAAIIPPLEMGGLVSALLPDYTLPIHVPAFLNFYLTVIYLPLNRSTTGAKFSLCPS